ncbi:uncharacterized protein LOC117583748 [Drosophila guanche]|uniref:uncharacterized protein LOC117583748 n=1 Tax=Drosophila guanche TaxID=7266 RepID=UPI001470EA24|nr:uncharacterized protein LOC117583748 [Drosophila guanche]
MEPKRERKRLYRGLDNHERNLSSSSSSPASVARQVSSEASDDPRPTTSAVAEAKRERKRLYRGLGNHELNLSSSSSSPASVARQDSAITITSSSQSSGTTQMVVSPDDPRPTPTCDKFLHEVLPIVNTYQLPTKVKKLLGLLDLHPCFRRIQQGYQYVPNAELSTCFVLKANRDFRLSSALPTSNDSAQASHSHTVLINDAAIKQKLSVGYYFKISPETASLFSAIVFNDMELSIGQRHDLADIHRRLRQVKQSFEATARVLAFGRNIHNVVYDMDIFVNIRTK